MIINLRVYMTEICHVLNLSNSVIDECVSLQEWTSWSLLSPYGLRARSNKIQRPAGKQIIYLVKYNFLSLRGGSFGDSKFS